MTKESAFYPRLRAMTSEWIDVFGYWGPVVFTDPEDEYRAVREAAGLMDFSVLRKIDIEGSGALELVNSLVTRDLAKLEPGQIAYGALTDANGKMIDDCTVMLRGRDRLRFCGVNDRDVDVFQEKATDTGVAVREFTDAMPHLCVQGPRSREILEQIANRDLSNETLPYYRFREDVKLAGIEVFMTRLGYTAELGYELWVDDSRAVELWDALIEVGARYGMKVIGTAAIDLLRIEGGFIIGGVEYDPTVSPYECGLGWSVALDKGDFQGREALARDREETRLRLTSVLLPSGGDQASGAAIFVDGDQVGFVTQAIVSPHLGGKTLGLAKLDKGFLEPGTPVQVRVREEVIAGTVIRHPAYDPDRRRAKNS